MKKTAMIIMILTLIVKLLGFIKDITLAFFFGASNISDAYIISLTIPTVIFSFIGAGLSNAFIPNYIKIKRTLGEKESLNFTNNVMNIVIMFCFVSTIFCLFFTKEIVLMFASGFKRETLNTAIVFTQISLLSIVFLGVIYVLISYLQANNSFSPSVLIGVILNIVIIGAIVVSKKIGNIYLAIGSLIGTILQLLILVPASFKKGYKYFFILNFKDKNIKYMVVLALPILLGTSVNQLNILVDRTLASNIVEGGISALNYANKLNLFVQGIFVVSLITVLFPAISTKAIDKNFKEFKHLLNESMIIIAILVIPISVGFMLFSNEIIEILFGRGAFTKKAISNTSTALFYYSLGIIWFGIREVLSRAFFALGDSRTPMTNAIVGVGINIFFNFVLSKYMGIGGLALATSVSAIITSILLIISLRKKIGSSGLNELLISYIKIVLSSFIMGYISKFSFDYFVIIFNPFLSLFLATIISILVYFIVLSFMKIEEVNSLKKFIRKKIKNG